jgi:hypothetical protein
MMRAPLSNQPTKKERAAFEKVFPRWHEYGGNHQYVPSARCLALLKHLPDRTQQALGQDGIRDLDVALARMASDGAHTLDFRSSIPFIRGRYYLRILWGREKRSLSRLIAEGQTRLHRQALVYAALSWLLVTSSAALALVALYVAEKRARHRPDGRPLLPARPVACEGVIP